MCDSDASISWFCKQVEVWRVLELSGEAVLEGDKAGVASTPDEILVANGGGSCTIGDFLVIHGVEIKAVFFDSKVSTLFSTKSAMTARAAKAAAAGLMVGMAERERKPSNHSLT